MTRFSRGLEKADWLTSILLDPSALAIIDRKKNLVKLAGGEYIALEKLESVYKSASLISNLCIHADSNANRPMAIVLPHEKNLAVLCQETGLGAGKEFSQLCVDESVKEAILKDLNAMGKKAGFKPLEVRGPLLVISLGGWFEKEVKVNYKSFC